MKLHNSRQPYHIWSGYTRLIFEGKMKFKFNHNLLFTRFLSRTFRRGGGGGGRLGDYATVTKFMNRIHMQSVILS